jgi:flagellar hook-associated protein 1 FlgK
VPLTTDFFTASGTTATTIAVNSVLLADPTQLQVNTSGAPGDNDIALAETANSGGAADTALGAFVEQVGDLVADAKDTDATQSALSTQVTDQRQSAEGVDLSQEMANLISEQQAYEASARVMNAFGTVIDALLSAVGG